MEKLKTALGAFAAFAFIAILIIPWTFGGFIGAVWAASNDNLLAVVLSVFIPFYGAGYTVVQLLNL